MQKQKYKDAWPLKASVVNFRADHTRIYAGGYAGEILNDLGFKRNKRLTKNKLIMVKILSNLHLKKAFH